jgi:hypothetical protein
MYLCIYVHVCAPEKTPRPTMKMEMRHAETIPGMRGGEYKGE